MNTGPVAYLALAGLVVLCAFFAGVVGRYALLFYREATGLRRLSTLAGAATVIAIIINIIVGTLTQPLSGLTPPPAKLGPSHEGGRETPRATP